MKRVLLPTDFSDNARKAIVYAIDMMGLEGVEYELLNLYHEPHAAATSMISLVDIAMQDSKDMLANEANALKEMYGDRLNLRTVAEYGDGGKGIARYAKKTNVDLTIMGSKGATGLKEVLVGSVASDAINHSDRPLLVVPEKAHFNTPCNIVAAIDRLENPDVLNPVRKFAKDFGCTLTYLRVLENGIGAGKPVYLKESEHYVEEVSEDPVQAIDQYVKDNKADFLVMFPGSHGFLDRLFKRSRTGRVAMHSNVPLLTVHK